MEKLEEKVLQTIKKYELIKKGDNIVIGVSGGPDSIALLYVLNRLKEELKIKIEVAHINHMLRQEADFETEFVEKVCKKIDVACHTKRVDVKKESERLKISTELAGRNIRYKFFEEVLKKVDGNKIATAHNLNDNAETVLMNIIRGSGTSGLKGIEKIRDGKFIRPIIECSREEIEKYCQENNLEPKYDKSNMENIYTRNKIRNLLIPYIKENLNPSIVESLNRLSAIASKEDEYFYKVVENKFDELKVTVDNTESSKNQCILNLKKFNELEYVIKSRLILYTINKLLGSTQGIEKVHIDDIIKLCGNNIGNKYLTPNKNIKVYVKKGKIFFYSI